jgi:hypothetical protein
MVAAPQYGMMFFIGASGKTYPIDVYVSDVAGGAVRWDGGAGAGTASPTFWIAPENVSLRDYAQVTGTADTEKLRLTSNGRPTSHLLRYGVHLTTLNNRPQLNIGFIKGTQISALQVSD